MYAIDFFHDVLRWDALGFPMRSWQVIWFLFWGLLPFLGLLWVVPFITTVNFADLFMQVRWVIGGGVGYVILQRMGGKMASFSGPFFIAITFALALFWDVSEPWLNPLWREGELVFLLLSGCIWMYAIDFFNDVLRWDELGLPMRSWQVIWFLFWGLLPFLGLLWVVPFITAINFADLFLLS